MFDCDKIKNNKNNRRYINDFILLAVVFLIAFLTFAGIKVTQKQGNVFEIKSTSDNGDRISVTKSLNKTGYYCIYRDLENEIVISDLITVKSVALDFSKNHVDSNLIYVIDGTVSCIYSDCPDLICVNTHSISCKGESIICLPHRILITVTDGEESSEGYDAVSW